MNDAIWYLGISGQQQGPLGTQQVLEMIRIGEVTQTAYAYGGGMAAWTPISQIPTFGSMFAAAVPPPPPPAGPAPLQIADQIDFEIVGQEMQFVEIVLDPGEAAIAEAGSLFYMDPDIRANERMFVNGGTERQKVAFAAAVPGKVLPIDLRQHKGALRCQRDAFLCAAKGIVVGSAGGLVTLEGQGLAFVHAGGTLVARDLAAGEALQIDAACLVAIEATVSHDLQGIATLTGPGRVWLQSHPFARLGGALAGRVESVRTSVSGVGPAR